MSSQDLENHKNHPFFIFMLTYDDCTVVDALDHVQTALDLGLRHIGFKDVGLPMEDMKKLVKKIRDYNGTVYLEVVSLDEQQEITSVKTALELGVDYLLGGIHPSKVIPLIKDKSVSYFPFAGKVIDHPSILCGTVNEIVTHAESLIDSPYISGFDLLAFRKKEGGFKELINTVCSKLKKPVIVAGSVDNFEKLSLIFSSNAFAFTIGTAIFDGHFNIENKTVSSQLESIIEWIKAH